MLKTRIFISHSAAEDPQVRPILDKVCDALAALGFELLVDIRQINTGDQWREKIHGFLQTCDATAVLFSPRALGSAWVLKEATILSYFKTHNPFPLALIRLPEVDPEEFKKSPWHPLNLPEDQHYKSADPTAIATEIARVAGPAQRDFGPLDAARAKVASVLEPQALELLENGCRRSAGSIAAPPGGRANGYYARLLARQLVEDSAVSLNGVVKQLEPLRLNGQGAREIVNQLAPLWVDVEEASWIAAAAARNATDRDLAFQGDYLADFTIPRYLARAYPDQPQFRCLIPVDDSSFEDLPGRVLECLDQWVRKGPYAAQLKRTPLSLPDFIRKHITKGTNPLFVRLPCVPSPQVMTQLRTDYSFVTFVLPLPPSEEATPEVARTNQSRLPNQVRLVNPFLTRQTEGFLIDSYSYAETFLQGL